MAAKVEVDPETQVIHRLDSPPADQADEELDACGLQCPGPILHLNRRMAELPAGRRLRVTATDPGFVSDVKGWAGLTGNKLLDVHPESGAYVALVEKSAAPSARPEARDSQSPAGFTAVVFSGSMDRALAALVLANGAAANSIPATLFFTFWGLSILRKGKKALKAGRNSELGIPNAESPEGRRDAPSSPIPNSEFPIPNSATPRRGLLDRMFAWMLPAGVRKLKLSQWHFAGIGRRLMNFRMKSKNIMDLDQLLASARAAGVRLVACQMSMDMLGLRPTDLIDGVELGGVATFMQSASAGRISLFI